MKKKAASSHRPERQDATRLHREMEARRQEMLKSMEISRKKLKALLHQPPKPPTDESR
jgi:hypothetical protein